MTTKYLYKTNYWKWVFIVFLETVVCSRLCFLLNVSDISFIGNKSNGMGRTFKGKSIL